MFVRCRYHSFFYLGLLLQPQLFRKNLTYAIYSEEISQPGIELLLFLGVYFFFGWKIEGAVWSTVISFIFALVLASYFLLHIFPFLQSKGPKIQINKQPDLYNEILSVSIPAAFAVLFGSFISWADRLLVGIYRSNSETGIYTTVSLLSVIFVIILSGIKVIFSPMIADLYAKNHLKRIEELYRVSTKWRIYLGLPILFTFIFAGRDILLIVFGTTYTAGYIPLVILIISQIINLGTGPMDILLIMTGRQNVWLAISGTMMLANILLNMVLIPAFGITGAAIGTAATVSGIFIIGLLSLKTDLHIWPYDNRFIKNHDRFHIDFSRVRRFDGGQYFSLNHSHIPDGCYLGSDIRALIY